jgi:hypothetical protein
VFIAGAEEGDGDIHPQIDTPDMSTSAKKNASFMGVSLPDISTIHHINNRIFSGLPERHFREFYPHVCCPGTASAMPPKSAGNIITARKNQNAFS